jgi:iron complex transport system permease protein
MSGAMLLPPGRAAGIYLRHAMLALFSLALLWWLAGLGAGHWAVPRWEDPLVRQLRVPRLINALLVGAALACSGAALQALFRNPLADPGLIGTSAGAALGVILVLAGGLSGLSVPLAAFGGGLLVTLAIVALNRLVGGGLAGLLILGVVVGASCGAVVGLLLLMSDDLVLRGATNWLAGSLAQWRGGDAIYVLPLMGLGFAILLATARDLDCLLLGDDTARSMGVDLIRVRTLTAVGAALLTGGAVTLSGIIGFVGMMIPNAVGVFCRRSRRALMLWSAWAGAVFLLLIDCVAREVAYPVDLPAGAVAALVGPACFLWIFWRLQRGHRD